LPSGPPSADLPTDPRSRLSQELVAIAGLVRRLVGGDRVDLVVHADDLRELTGDGSGSSPLEVSATVAIVASGPVAQVLWARFGDEAGAGACVDGRRVLLAAGDGVGLVAGPPIDGLSPDALALGQSLAALATAAVAAAAELVRARARIRELVELSAIDALTDLGNRRHLDRILPVEIARRRRYERSLTVMMLDLDRFKAINDLHGHDGGDAVLRAVADLLRSALRGSDVGVRYGGEEFAVVLPETPSERAAHVAERIRRATEALDVGGIRVTVSIGVASVEGRWEGDAAALMRAADQALYTAKREGRNRVVYTNLEEGSTDSSPRIVPLRLDEKS
jgi:diguanylate cyclase (GGDEF)-like protein